jgi:ribosomal protein S18 acetylase RimI-like enzyme
MLRAEDRSSSQEAICESLSVKFEEVTDKSSEEFKEAMRIYAASFPANVKRPVASIEEMLTSGKSHLVVGRLDDDEIVLMALLYPLKGTPFVLGDYLAVAEEHRGKGIGTLYIKNIFSIIGDDQIKYFLGEVENPYLDGNITKVRRANFFRGLGMKELKGIRYLLPSLKGSLPTEMILMILPRMNTDHLEGNVIRKVIIQIFGELYNRDEGDEILASILKGVPERIKLD